MEMKIKHIMRKIMIFFIIILFLVCQNSFLYAIDYTGGEFRPRPTEEGGGTIITPPPTDDNSSNLNDTEYHEYIAGIGGKVSEIVEAINEQVLGNKGQDSSSVTTQKGVKNIYVQADNGKTTQTNENGEYYFSLQPGETINKITFKYGYLEEEYIENTTVSNYKERQEILKYNGQDYGVVANTYTNTIELMKKGCAQVYLVLDCSVSMEEKITLANGEETTKLQVEKQIATNLINSLLDGNKNVYVGLIVFTGEVYRKTSLTNDKNILLEAINGEIEFNDYYYTNIKGAIEKAYDSYANNLKETSNRYMFLLSDGLPTADGDASHTLYTATSQAEIDENNRKLQLIAENTKNAAQKILQEEIKLYSVFAMDDSDESDKQLINDIFNNFQENSQYNTFKQVDTIENVSNEIIQEFVQYVKDSIEITSTGYEVNKNYREDILQENYSKFNYQNTAYFQALDMEVTADNLEEFKGYLRQLVEEATITVEVPTSATGETPIIPYTENITNEAGEVIGTKRHEPKAKTLSGPDLTLALIPEFTLNPTIAVTGLEVIAQNGSILDSLETTVEKNEDLMTTIEEVMLYGSEVRVQCTLNVTNVSVYNDCKNIQMMCYLPDEFEYKGGTAIGIGRDGQTELGIKSAIILNKKNVDSFSAIPEPIKNYIKEGHTAVAILVDVNKNNFQLLTNGIIQIKLVTSRLLPSKIEDMTYDVDAEIFGYANASYRRIQYKATEASYLAGTTVGLVGEVAGNRDIKEADFAESSNLGIILIPTGGDRRLDKIVLATLILGIIGMSIYHKINRK